MKDEALTDGGERTVCGGAKTAKMQVRSEQDEAAAEREGGRALTGRTGAEFGDVFAAEWVG
jgi:hypothetical protein